ncbi:hypothetical protein EB796_000139 [Bugula neritina]|uniref:Protein kinase domain-containing protein n=1 Tax=Bugula neritina TaxID=10212 RepID=A0A7J7KTQ1_BUGNE|nr:hypothetical protein EB796_000139 [Bugula neritina]
MQVLRDVPKSRREVTLHVKAVACRHIVQIKDVYENVYGGNKCLLVVMECMNGGELFTSIQERADNAFNERGYSIIMCFTTILSNTMHSDTCVHNWYQ